MKRKIFMTLMAMAMVTTPMMGSAITANAAGLTQIENPADVQYGAFVQGEDKSLISSMFDADYYAETNADVVEFIKKEHGENISKAQMKAYLLDHFCKRGIYEGRSLSANFNVSAFASAYSSELGFGTDLLKYYRYAATHDLKAEGKTVTTLKAAADAGVTVKSIVNPTVVITPELYHKAEQYALASLSTVNALLSEQATRVANTQAQVAIAVLDDTVSTSAFMEGNRPAESKTEVVQSSESVAPSSNNHVTVPSRTEAQILAETIAMTHTYASINDSTAWSFKILVDKNGNYALYNASDISGDASAWMSATPISAQSGFNVSDVYVVDNTTPLLSRDVNVNVVYTDTNVNISTEVTNQDRTNIPPISIKRDNYTVGVMLDELAQSNGSAPAPCVTIGYYGENGGYMVSKDAVDRATEAEFNMAIMENEGSSIATVGGDAYVAPEQTPSEPVVTPEPQPQPEEPVPTPETPSNEQTPESTPEQTPEQTPESTPEQTPEAAE